MDVSIIIIVKAVFLTFARRSVFDISHKGISEGRSYHRQCEQDVRLQTNLFPQKKLNGIKNQSAYDARRGYTAMPDDEK